MYQIRCTTLRSIIAAIVLAVASTTAVAQQVKFVLVAPLTGPSEWLGQKMLEGAKAAVSEVNERWGVQGNPMTFEVLDDACDPRQALGIARRLVRERHRINIVVGHCPTTAGIVAPLYNDKDYIDKVYNGKGVIYLAPLSHDIDFPPDDRYYDGRVFRFVPGDATDSTATIVQAAFELLAQSINLISAPTINPDSIALALRSRSQDTILGQLQSGETGRIPIYPSRPSPAPPSRPSAPPPPITPVDPPSPPIKPPIPSTDDLTWNFWAEEGDSGKRRYSAVKHLIPRTAYRLFINLSALKYKSTGVASQRISETLKIKLEELISLSKPNVELTALLAVHPAFFELPKTAAMKLQIDIAKIREYLGGNVQLPSGDPFDALQALARQYRDPDFVFADSHFVLHARGKQGMTDVVVAFAKDGVPIGSVSIPLCIATASTASELCKAPSLSISSTDIDALRIAGEGARQPAASLQFVETRSGPVMGMLRTFAGKETFYFWPLSMNGHKLRATLRDTIAPNLSRSSATEEDLHTYGLALLNALFPHKDFDDAASNDATEKAREAFTKVVRDEIQNQERLPSSIFIRIDYENVDEPVFLPMGYLPTSTDGASPDFVGFHFSINVPLPKQAYQVNTECISRWHLAIPHTGEADNTIQETLERGHLSIDRWNTMATNTFKSMGDFIGWVKQAESVSGALMVLSHQDRNTISFRQNGRTLPAGALMRNFKRPSIAILNGCGTGEVGASDFVTRLNALGVHSVIATNAEVDRFMAADFFNCLDAELVKHKDDASHRLSTAYFNTVQCLRKRRVEDGKEGDEDDDVWGGRALKYMLLGNGNVRLCLPNKE